MQPDPWSSYVEGTEAVPAVDPGELLRTGRWQATTRGDDHGTPSSCPRS